MALDPSTRKRAEELLGHRFKDPSLLETALTHPSKSNGDSHVRNYERLEFLGDSVLGYIVAEELFKRFDDVDEGGLTRIKINVVEGRTLAKVGDQLGLVDMIEFGKTEIATKRRGIESALENVMEALIGALYLDAGVEAARRWVLQVLDPYMDRRLAEKPDHPKSLLQELLQAKGGKPVYKQVGQSGPPHDRTFAFEVYDDEVLLGSGEGRSKKEAEMNAATAALQALGA